MNPTPLDSIGILHQTDKASQFSRTYAKPHDYLRHMEMFFAPIRVKELKFLEIGVGGGESIRTWLQYFPNAHIFGIDNNHSTNDWNTVTPTAHPRYQFVIGDQSDPTFWKCFEVDYGIGWDVVIDDGSHISKDAIETFNAMWPNVKSGGLYIVEDLGCAYGNSGFFCPPGWPNHMEFLRSHLDAMNCGNPEIDSMYFSKELCIIRKR